MHSTLYPPRSVDPPADRKTDRRCYTHVIFKQTECYFLSICVFVNSLPNIPCRLYNQLAMRRGGGGRYGTVPQEHHVDNGINFFRRGTTTRRRTVQWHRMTALNANERVIYFRYLFDCHTVTHKWHSEAITQRSNDLAKIDEQLGKRVLEVI